MKIALIFPPYTHKLFSENLSVVDEEFCLAPPIILAYVAAILEKNGHKVILIDARALNLSRDEVLERLKFFNPDMLGFRAESYHFHDALGWMGYFKNHLRIPVISGGPNLSLYPEETLSHPEIDYGIIGEAVESLPALLRAIEDKTSLKDIPGIAYKDSSSEVRINPFSGKYVEFDHYPFPARHLLPNDRYYSFISQRKNFTIMLTTTGCPYRCSFCAIHSNTKYRLRSAKNVVDEIEVCYKEFGVREIDFFDATFFLGKSRLSEIFREIKCRNLEFEWSCRSRVDVVDEDILSQAASVGCRQIYYGIESVNQRVLGTIKKDIELEQVRWAIKFSNKCGIKTMGFFMVGNPGDSKGSVRDTISFAKDLGLDFIQVCRAIAKPGTELDKIMIEKTGKDYWRRDIKGDKIKGRLPTPWASLSELQIEALTKEFYLKFYFRPNMLWRRIIQLKSLSEFKRYARVGWKMLLQRSELYSHLITDTSEAEITLEESNSYLEGARKAKVAIIIPTYNEKDNISGIIKAILDILPQAYIVVIDDNSPDGTADIAQGLCRGNNRIRLVRRPKKSGLGQAYKEGFAYVLKNLDAEYIFEMDADFSHNPQYMPMFLHYAKTFDLVTGSRFLHRVSIKNRTILRNIISKSTKWSANILLNLRFTDVTTGFKCFKRTILEKLDFNKIESNGFAFQIEVTYYINQIGGKIKEIPILFYERTVGDSKMSFEIIFEGVILVMKLLRRRIFKKYELKK
jgi:radical SAM superfamily enzyme YgiQ (UPF0313 family)